MNFLKKYSRVSQLSYSSIRTFAYNANRSNAPIGSGTKNTATETSSTGIGIRSASPSYSPSYNSSITGASGRNPEHITSTDTRFSSFNTSGPTSGFNTSESQDMASSSQRFADSTADSLKNLADQAANTAKSFVDQATGQNTGRRETSYYGNQRDNTYDANRNRSQNPIDDLVNTAGSVAQGVAQGVGDLAQGAVSAATSFGSNFIPQDQGRTYESRRPSYYDEHDYSRNQRIRDFGSGSGSTYSSPYQDTRYNSYDQNYRSRDPVQEIGQFVNSAATNMADAANQAANTARNVFDQATGTTRTTGYNNNSYDYQTTSQSMNQTAGSPFETAQALAGTAANLAGYAIKGMADNAAYFASAFMPGSMSSSSRSESAYPNTTSHTERSAAFNTQRTNNYGNQSYDSGYTYNPYASTENRRVEHLISTDTRFNAFSSVGHVSGFGAPSSFGAGDVSYAAKSFADSAASNFKGAVDQAAGTVKDFMGQTSREFTSTGNPVLDMINEAAYTAQQVAAETLNNAVNIANSCANSFIPQGQVQGRQDNYNQYGDRSGSGSVYHQDQNYINTNSNRRPQNFTSTDTSSNFFNPGQGSGSHPVSPFDNPIGNFVSSFAQGNPVTSMIQGAAYMASSFIPGSQQQNPNFFRQNQYSSSQSDARDPISQTINTAANVAQGLANTAASIASTFIPGSQNQRNPSR